MPHLLGGEVAVTARWQLSGELLTRTGNVQLIAGADVRYGMGQVYPAPATGSRQAGSCRISVTTEDGEHRLAEQLHDGCLVLLDASDGPELLSGGGALVRGRVRRACP